MALFHNPQIATSGLVFAYDSANRKSYQGPPIQNRMTSISPMTTSGTGYSFVGGSEYSDIPTIGPTLVQYSNIQNNYSAVSTWCCPNPFTYHGGGTVSVSGSTVYTYAIVYRVESGYTNGNYMYRYEYNSGGGYLTEGGVHSDSNRVHLGNGWYWAWGTFTTQPTASLLNVYSFYYRYSSSYDKMSVANVLLVAGDYTGLHPRYWPSVNTTRATTAAILDLTNKNTITASSLTYASNGTISFNGSNYASVNAITGLSDFTVEIWFKSDSVANYRNPIDCNWLRYPGSYSNVGPRLEQEQNSGGKLNWIFGDMSGNYEYRDVVSSGLNPSVYHCTCLTKNGNIFTSFYNGSVVQSAAATYTWPGNFNNINIGRGFQDSGERWFIGQIPSVKTYNRALTAAEVAQNFNAQRTRYSI